MTGESVSTTVSLRRSSLRKSIVALLAVGAGIVPLCSHALPVIPNAAGYGIETPAGRGGTIYKVTNLAASGAGSLQACVAATGPRVCVFEVSGIIHLTQDLAIHNPNITIAGQTAPSPGIMLRGGALRITTSDVLVQHVRVRVGDDSNGPTMSNRDALKIESAPDRPIKNIVVDHCSFSWAVDENAALWNAWDNVTLSNNIIAEGLYQSLIPNGVLGGYGLIVSPTKGRVSAVGNLLAHNRERNPLSRGEQLVFVNNVVYNPKTTSVDLQSENGITTMSSVAGNVFLRGPDTGDRTPITIRTDDKLGITSASKLYVQDNDSVVMSGDDQWSIVSAYTGILPTTLAATSPPAWPSGLTLFATDGTVVLSSVLNNAGARPADRDSVDNRVVASVRERKGQIINCVSSDGSERCKRNAGGWPSMAENRRTLTLPADPNEVTPSGYTRLEQWLHQMAAEVEGRPDLGRPQAPMLSVR